VWIWDLDRWGDRSAVVTVDGALTYRELSDRVAARADELGAARRLVLLTGADQVEALVTYLAALRAGHPLLLAPGDDPSHLDGLVAAYDPDIVISPGGTDVRRTTSAHRLHPDLALLLTTSGSTGSPKLVRLSHHNLQSNAESIAQYLDIRPTDRAATSLPMHYCYGLSVINSHLVRGAGLVLSDRSVVDRCFWDTFRAAEATTFAGVPYTFDLLDRVGFESMALPSLRYVTQAGGRLAPERVRRYAELGRRDGWEFYVMYGQTEATARMAYLPPALATARPEAIGVAVPGGALRIDDGELVYRGPNVMLGYAEGPGDLALGRTVHELRTGDLARRTPDGLYEVVGRRSRFVKLFGLRIDLEHVERTFADNGVDAVCAGDDEQLVVAVRPGQDGEQVRRLAKRHVGLPPTGVRVCTFEELPRLPSGKPDYVAIAAARGDDAAAEVTGSVRQLFADVLRCPAVADDETFVTLGGDSLSYVELSIGLEDILGFVPPDWHLTPVGRLAAMVPRRRRVTRVETNVVLRAVAIVLVVGSHVGLFHVRGGAHVLLAVAGFNFARLQLAATERTERLPQMLASVARIAVPSMLWIAFSRVAFGADFGLANVFLVNDHVGPNEWSERWHFWYVEALVQFLLVGALLFSVPAVRRLERARPYGFPMALLAAALAVRFDVVTVWGTHSPLSEPQTVLWCFLVGWVAARAVTLPQKVLLSAVVAVAVPGFFSNGPREAVVAGGLLLLLWVPSLPVVRPVNRVAGAIAAASLAIYLTHWEVWPPVLDRFSPLVAVAASLAVGVGAWTGVQRLGVLLLPRARRAGWDRPDMVLTPR
jgi:acyl-CoA synthetase (AMP-forming)/AMP-acid ligase II/acyl carrier protein